MMEGMRKLEERRGFKEMVVGYWALGPISLKQSLNVLFSHLTTSNLIIDFCNCPINYNKYYFGFYNGN